MKLPQKVHQRTSYLEQVKPFIGQNIIKVFTGQRRVGKSYLLFQLIGLIQKISPKATIIYINKEDLAFASIKNAKDLSDYVLARKNKKGTSCIFIDEIQEIKDFHVALRSLLLDQSLDLYCTGSNAHLLSADIAGYLSGRSIEITVYSLAYTEFLDFHQLPNSTETIEKYLKYGGLPYLKHLELNDEIVFEYLKNIYNTIVYRDIINRYAVRNTLFLEQLIIFLAGNIGSLFSAKKISDFLKSQKVNMAANQVQTYVQHFANAFLLHRVPRYDIIGKRVFETGEKFYFENLGIRNGLCGYKVQDKGKIMENVVYNHLVGKGYKVSVGTMGAQEIDFICSKNNETRYIQVALSIHTTNTLEREFGNLQKIPDQYPKEVITWEGFNGNTYQGIKHSSLQQFLVS
jgi:predicted AAA+ superfamily ATPase